ncbi:hypothetical protein, partial [Mycolicibacterium sp.]|uniref:hypothetical protein n=1 Tax=Mycolicibacterium sp. TaxID=2320850 RepID=UPI00355D5C15
MAIRRRQLAVVSLVMVLAAILIGGPLATPPSAIAQGDESFITPLTPGKLYADDASHDVVIPIPSSGLQGYCVAVSGEGHRAAGPTYGFHVDPAVGTIVYNPADPDAPNNPKYFDNGSATTTDDVYCVAVRANPRPAGNLPGEPMAPAEPLVIYWDYYDEAADRVFTVASDPIPVVTVRLVGFDGFIGGRALVCTEGWDPTFLTGATANAGATSNPLDDVRLADWTILTPGAVALGEPFLNTSDFTTQNPGGNPLPRPEWCLSLAGTAAINDVPVEFNFVAVYDTAHTGDDHDVTVNSTGAGIDFIGATEPELRHVNSAGHLVEGAVSINAIASSHTVCALPTSTHNGDTLDPVIIDGKLAQPLVDNDATNGIPDGTLCFRWSESTPKIQDISATIDFGGGGGWGPDVRAIWDTDGDGNGFRPGPTPDDIGRLLMKEWWRAHATRITTGPDYADPSTDVTDKRIDVPIIFNAGTGNFIGSVGLNEWVLGAPQEDPAPADLRPLDGVRAEFKLLPGRSGQNVCGYFEANGVALGAQEFDAPANAGRIEFKVNIAPGGAAKGCRPGDELLVTIDTFYGDDEPTGIPQETVRLRVGIDGRYDPPQAVPQLAWAGQKVEIFYGFAARSCIGLVATFVSPEDQPGAFIAPGHQQGAKAVRIPFDEDDCSATVHYVSPNPGVVDIIATFEDTDPVDGTISGDFSKVYFPLFFLAFEDLEVGSPGSLVVSEEGLLTAWVRGWFISANPSGRPEETKGDGRTLPADRWVLPDDWERLRGDANFRQWPSSAPMPPATVTFFMENEHIRNAYRSETEGGAGIFISDGDNGEFDWNINPVTRTPSVLGTAGRPRIVSENTDTGGAADTGIFGDYNLGFDECAVNRPTGNPHCAPGDIVGRTRYYAVVDYPEHRPNNPPVRSNTTETAFTWAGYKQLSVV